jgi:predicted nucleic acid-binding protein
VRYVLDTDVLIEIFRNNRLVHDAVGRLRQDGHVLCYSPVTRAEIYAGLRPGEETDTAWVLSRLTCLVIDAPVGEKAGYYIQTFRRSHSLRIGDALIAASTVLAGAHLITFNARHYPMPDIRIHHMQRTTE